MSPKGIIPGNSITIELYSHGTISIIVHNRFQPFLDARSIIKYKSTNSIIQDVVECIQEFIDTYQPNIIILQESKILSFCIGGTPDPLLLRNIVLGFKLSTIINYVFGSKVEYILELPELKWKKEVLNTNINYSIDLYKAHLRLENYTKEQLEIIDTNNYYKALCLSESLEYNTLMLKKYQIN